MPDVRITALAKDFGENTVLDEVDLHIADGEFFTLLGPSGCGKSTTLNCVAGLERPTGGAISVGGQTFVDAAKGVFLQPEERNLGMVFQSYALWPHKTIAENLALPLKLRKVGRAERERLITDALDKVGLAALESRYPHQLSGGQQQRVALARALVYSPSVLLLDEPLSNLDAKLREQARAWLKKLQEDLGITTVYVTHDQEEALALSDRIAVMSDGNLLQVGTPTEIYETPASIEVAAFVGRCSFLPGTVAQRRDGKIAVLLDGDVGTVEVVSDLDAAHGEAVTVAVRPERWEAVRVGAEHAGMNALRAEVLTSSYVGSRYEYHMRLGEHVVRVDSASSRIEGDAALVFGPEDARLFAEAAVPAAAEDALLALAD
ncbi:ABC transporter ATP-binding protein [Glycomyces sp. NPDC048151]|uniref:ABC transporter ATP-binding protein n=1 Tax=Glycomyces sp. NPDC048151 TaxID=3364002 RepID=UPI0037139225